MIAQDKTADSSVLNSRTRVLTAMKCREPDRIPIFPPNRVETSEPWDPTLLEFLDSFPFDRFVRPAGLADHPDNMFEVSDGLFGNAYGCRFKPEGHGIPYCVFSPLAQAESLQDIESFDWPDLPDLVMSEENVNQVRAARAAGEHAIVLRFDQVFHQYAFVRGFEQWLMDSITEPEIFREISERMYQYNLAMIMSELEQVGSYVDVVTASDDLGTSTAPFVSLESFRTLMKPYYVDLIAKIKARWPHIIFWFHSHGQIMDLVPDLIDARVDVLNPILPLDHMDAAVLKNKYGQELCFHGGIDIEGVIPFGTVEEVKDHVKRSIDTLAPDGGYILGLQVISAMFPTKNVIAAYECALEHGTY